MPKCTEKRLKRDLYAMRESKILGETAEFIWCDTLHQRADPLTKVMEVDGIVKVFQEGKIPVGLSAEHAKRQAKKKSQQAKRAARQAYKTYAWNPCMNKFKKRWPGSKF